jgi:hypothetical protein
MPEDEVLCLDSEKLPPLFYAASDFGWTARSIFFRFDCGARHTPCAVLVSTHEFFCAK